MGHGWCGNTGAWVMGHEWCGNTVGMDDGAWVGREHWGMGGGA